jgi:NADPH2:quinone reductase
VIPSIKANLVLLKQADVTGVGFRQYFQHFPHLARIDVEHLCRLRQAGTLAPAVPTVMPFDEALTILKTVAQRSAVGKLALSLMYDL